MGLVEGQGPGALRFAEILRFAQDDRGGGMADRAGHEGTTPSILIEDNKISL